MSLTSRCRGGRGGGHSTPAWGLPHPSSQGPEQDRPLRPQLADSRAPGILSARSGLLAPEPVPRGRSAVCRLHGKAALGEAGLWPPETAC